MNGWKYDLNLIAGAGMLGQLSGHIESEDLGNYLSRIDVYSHYGLL